jgi:hypothetical protein
MKKELDEKLCRDFPLLYSDRNLSISETEISWGFQCNDGWFNLIYELSEKLERMIETWIIANGSVENHPRACCVKEKFGTLRFYLASDTDEMYDEIRKYERKSKEVCEVCGEPGKLGGKYWLKTTCKKHIKESFLETLE